MGIVLSGGYTPVFASVFSGTLYGKWPDTAAWLYMLALADSRGQIDMTPEAISGLTGMPLSDLLGCIERFLQPDPRSRSAAADGRRLVLIDPARSWGWRVVNIQLYRDRASGRDQIEDGRNAAKVKRYKERHRQTPADTRGTGESPQTPTHTQTQTQTEEETSLRSVSTRTGARARPKTRRVPQDFQVTEEMRKWAREVSPSIDVDRETEAFRDHQFRDARSDWDATWRQWMRRAPEFKRNGATPRPEESKLTWRPGPDD